MYRSPLDVSQHAHYKFNIPLSRCFFDSRGKEDLIDTVDTAQVDEPHRADGVFLLVGLSGALELNRMNILF